MSESLRRTKSGESAHTDAAEEISGTNRSGADGLADELDGLLDEIDELLESNAEEFVKNYVQKGGE